MHSSNVGNVVTVTVARGNGGRFAKLAPVSLPNPYTESTKGLTVDQRRTAIRAEYLRRAGKAV